MLLNWNSSGSTALTNGHHTIFETIIPVVAAEELDGGETDAETPNDVNADETNGDEPQDGGAGEAGNTDETGGIGPPEDEYKN